MFFKMCYLFKSLMHFKSNAAELLNQEHLDIDSIHLNHIAV